MAQPEVPPTPGLGDGGTKLYGMENFGNTCYCNSILQCLYYSTKFRQQVLAHCPTPHERRVVMPGASPHAYTAKYEQILVKRMKEKGEALLATSAGVPPSRPSIKNSFFGKFSSQNTPVLSSDDASLLSHKHRDFVEKACCCESLTTEQRLIIRQTPDFHDLQLLVTRPTSNTAAELRNDSSVSSSTLLESSNGSLNASVSTEPMPISSASSYVVIGIPHPEQGLSVPINPFNPNPSADHRKRSALINGPVLNVDHPFSEASQCDTKCLLYALKDIFESMAENSSQIGVVSPLYFVKKLKEKNFLFRQANMHHDAHEFCNYLVNEIIETLNSESGSANNWCTRLFQGTITNETKCLSCETVTSKDESFLDLSIDIPPGESAYSLTFCLNNFSKSETLNHQNKFYCNACSSLQEAVKTIKLKKTPEILVINFKRFKYDDKLDRMVKLFDSISYPLNLRLFNTTMTATTDSDENDNSTTTADFSLYGLYALVVHIGGGPMHGHYVALCKCQAGLWFLFDDETVELVNDSYVLQFFGDGPGLASAYMLFYEIVDTKVADDGSDFGIDLSKVYNGRDYSIAKSVSQAAGCSKKDQKTTNKSSQFEEAESNFSTEQNLSETVDDNLSRTTSILKKTFMLDSKDSDRSKEQSAPNTSASTNTESQRPAIKAEKKSWVGGLKRRESKPELGTKERSASVSSSNMASSTHVDTNTADASTSEKPKRKGGLFSFKRKAKS